MFVFCLSLWWLTRAEHPQDSPLPGFLHKSLPRWVVYMQKLSTPHHLQDVHWLMGNSFVCAMLKTDGMPILSCLSLQLLWTISGHYNSLAEKQSPILCSYRMPIPMSSCPLSFFLYSPPGTVAKFEKLDISVSPGGTNQEKQVFSVFLVMYLECLPQPRECV